jgi:hypothetical protein
MITATIILALLALLVASDSDPDHEEPDRVAVRHTRR